MFAAFGFGGGDSTFSATYRVYPVSFLEKESAERGDKLILPPSALDRLGESKPPSFFSMLFHSALCLVSFFVFCCASAGSKPKGLMKRSRRDLQQL